MKVYKMHVFVSFILYSFAAHVRGSQDESFKQIIINEITELKTRQNLCDAKVSELEDTLQELKERNENLEIRLGMKFQKENYNIQSQDFTDNLKSNQTRQKRIPTSRQVGFTVGISSADLTHLGDHQTIIFDQTITNSGSAFSLNSGIFQAPFKGIYVFTLTLMVAHRHSEYLDIVVDGKFINQILADASSVDDFMSTTKQWVLDLNVGSEVWIRTSSVENMGEIHGNMHTTFSGFLLFETE